MSSNAWGSDSDNEAPVNNRVRAPRGKPAAKQNKAGAAPTTAPAANAPAAAAAASRPAAPPKPKISDAEMKDHVNHIKSDPDYLFRLVRKDDTGKEFNNAITSYETLVGKQQVNRVPLFLPNGFLNTSVLTAPTQAAGSSIISTAINAKNFKAANRALKWFLEGGNKIEARAVASLLEGYSNNVELVAFIQAHSDLFSLSQSAIAISTNVTRKTIQLENKARADAANKLAELIGTHAPGVGAALDAFVKTNSYPLINSCGYILTSVRTTTVVDNVTKETSQHIAFLYKNNQSLFRHAIDCNNATALRELLQHCAKHFPHSTGVPALYDAVMSENRLDFVPSLTDYIIRSATNTTQRNATFDQFIKHPITGQSFFAVLFDRIANVQRLHNEYQFDGVISFASTGQAPTTAQPFGGDATGAVGPTLQQQHPAAAPTSPQIYRLFTELLHSAVFAIFIVSQLFAVDNNERALQQFARVYQKSLTQLGFNDSTQLRSAQLLAGRKMMELYTTFATAASEIQNRLKPGTIPAIVATSHNNFAKRNDAAKRKNANNGANDSLSPSIDFIEEFTLSALIQFIPYLSPRWLIKALTKVPQVYVPLLNQLLPKLPSPYFRNSNATSRFPIHCNLFEFRTKPRQTTGDLTAVLPVAPQILTSIHLRLPSYISTLSPLNVYPTDPKKAAEMYGILNWDDSSIRAMQNQRLLRFQTELTDAQRSQVHPMILLKFHPLTIIQALYIYSTAPPTADFFKNPVTELLLEQLDDLSCSSDPFHYSIVTPEDAPALKTLADSDTIIPTQLLPLLTPTLVDFLYFCRERKFASVEERAFYVAYFMDIAESGNLVNLAKKDELVQVVSKKHLKNYAEMLTKAAAWVPPANYVTGARLVSLDLFTEQEGAMRRVCDPSLTEEYLTRHAQAAESHLPFFEGHALPQEVEAPEVEQPQRPAAESAVAADLSDPTELGRQIDRITESFMSLSATFRTMDDDDSDDDQNDEPIDLTKIDWAALGVMDDE